MAFPDWTDLRYLAAGTPRQQAAYRALCDLAVVDRLRQYGPVLVGTIPLHIDIPTSDLDIICEMHDPDQFAAYVEAAFGSQSGFRLKHTITNDLPTVTANFDYPTADVPPGFPIEIFGQPRPVTAQHAYRHMVVEARLLRLGGEQARTAIRDLKLQHGLKTEPAFARYFGLAGDPFVTLLALADLDDAALQAAVGLGGIPGI